MARYLGLEDAFRKLRRRTSSVSSLSLNGMNLNKLEKSWFIAASECNIFKLKQYYGKDKELLNKKAVVHWAAKKGLIDLFPWFLEEKADLNLRTGYTPLHIAAIQDKENIIRYLIQYGGVDVDLRDYSGRKASNYLKENASLSIKSLMQYQPSYLNVNKEVLDIVRSPILFNSKVTTRQDMEKDDLDERRKKKLSVVQSFRSKRSNRRYLGDKQQIYQHRSLIDISSKSMDSLSNPSITISEPPLERRNSTISELVVNGYAGFIREKKVHNNSDENARKSVSSECSEDSQDCKINHYNINTWV